MRLTGVSVLCFFASLPFSKVSAPGKLPAQAENPSVEACLSYGPSVVEITGTITRKTFADATDRPETYWVLAVVRPICVNEDPREPDLNYAQKGVRAIQLVFLNPKMYVTYNNLVGRKVIAKGTLSAGITAHHHTPVLLMVSALKIAG